MIPTHLLLLFFQCVVSTGRAFLLLSTRRDAYSSSSSSSSSSSFFLVVEQARRRRGGPSCDVLSRRTRQSNNVFVSASTHNDDDDNTHTPSSSSSSSPWSTSSWENFPATGGNKKEEEYEDSGGDSTATASHDHSANDASSSSSSSSSSSVTTWSVEDDWGARSQWENRPMRSQDIFHQDILARAAYLMQQQQQQQTKQNETESFFSKKEEPEAADVLFMKGVLDMIHATPSSENHNAMMEQQDPDQVAATTTTGTATATTTTSADDSTSTKHFHDEAVMEQEIAQLVRCNQDPTQFLIQQGRIIPPLTETELHHVRQLVVVVVVESDHAKHDDDDDDKSTQNAAPTFRQVVQPTLFFRQAIESIFNQHANVKKTTSTTTTSATTTTTTTDEKVMDAKSVAKWLQQAISIPSSRCGPHDPRVQHIIRTNGNYGTGYLDLENFQQLYLRAVVGDAPMPQRHPPNDSELRAKKKENDDDDNDDGEFYRWLRLTRSHEIDQVWNDLEMHDIEPPAYTEWKEKVLALHTTMELDSNHNNANDNGVVLQEGGDRSFLFHDECELMDDDMDGRSHNQIGASYDNTLLLDSWKQDVDTGVWTNMGKSSHERIELCSINDQQASSQQKQKLLLDPILKKKQTEEQETKKTKIPLRFRDGDFVVIDEESCIGCMQCAVTAPSSFRMMPSSGRARTYRQDTSPAVSAAVASCPVNCMHHVGFERLVELERARDYDEFPSAANGEAQYHRHFGTRYQNDQHPSINNNNVGGERKSNLNRLDSVEQTMPNKKASSSSATQWIGHTPMYVSRMESSDANHKESIYHHLRNQCFKSSACPQRGCYDCPMYKNSPDTNPHLAQKQKEANHIRAQHFIATGAAALYRKTAEL